MVFVLFVVVFVMVLIVVLLWYVWIDGWFGFVIDGNDYWVFLFGMMGMFFIGGLFVVLICWFFEYFLDVDCFVWKGGSVWNVFIVNVVCVVVGVYLFYFLMWNWVYVLLFLLVLCGVGSVIFVFVFCL